MTTAPDLSLLLYGWAPGDYTPKCFDCSGRHHNSDKRSMRCRPCAEKVRDEHTAKTEPLSRLGELLGEVAVTFTAAEISALRKAALGFHVIGDQANDLNSAIRKLG
tara:strand:+ start:1125 stop:1442 length:318 start_codon:yes stop_codon:yes gene_type:complete